MTEGRKILEVNLTDGTSKTTVVPADICRKFIGASGLAAKLMFDRVDPNVDPLSPDNPLFILAGPVSGTSVPGGARFCVVTKSPLTNMFAETSCGGDFARELRSAGYEGLIIEGAAQKPTYLVIEDGQVQFKDAADLWGKNVYELTDLLEQRHGQSKRGTSLTIGVAGENLVKFALIANGTRNFASRCGVGTVMGSKKLKAVWVRGSGKLPIADEAGFGESRKVMLGKAKESVAVQMLHEQGTNAAVSYSNMLGDLPGKNWTQGDNSAIAAGINGSVLSGPDFFIGPKTCHGCMIACKREVHITEGPYKGMEGPGPEYEGVASTGSLLLIGDMAAVIKMNETCNDLGLDVISCGATIAAAMDWWEQGIISAKDTDGIELKWGDDVAVLKMMNKIAHREGFGDLLAEGSRRAGRKLGGKAPDYAVEVKGLEVPMHDPRANFLCGLAYATGVRGACHTNDVAYSAGTGILNWPEIGLPPGINTHVEEGSGELVSRCQDLGQIFGAASFCYMTLLAMGADDATDMLKTSSGFDYTFEELRECAERIWHLKRGMDCLMGITAADDRLPRQILTPNTDGGAAGAAPKLDIMLKEYYPARGLDEQGRPTKETLQRLGLSDLSAKLHG